jgi:hypothetical protein
LLSLERQFEGDAQNLLNEDLHILCSFFTVCRIIPNELGSIIAFTIRVVTAAQFSGDRIVAANASQQIEVFPAEVINHWRKFRDRRQ